MSDYRTASFNQNLQNRVGRTNADTIAKQGTQTEKNILPAGESQYFAMAGDFFYVEAASGQINIAPDCAYGKGPENPYTSGKGLNVDRENAFHGLQIRNPDPDNALFFQLKAGFDRLIDNTLVYPDLIFKNIPFKVYDSYHDPGVASVLVPDLSGTLQTDSNGNEWYLVNRQLLICWNNDTTGGGNSYFSVSNTAGSVFLGSVLPSTANQLAYGGDLKVALLGGTSMSLGGIITELYQCLPKL